MIQTTHRPGRSEHKPKRGHANGAVRAKRALWTHKSGCVWFEKPIGNKSATASPKRTCSAYRICARKPERRRPGASNSRRRAEDRKQQYGRVMRGNRNIARAKNSSDCKRLQPQRATSLLVPCGVASQGSMTDSVLRVCSTAADPKISGHS